VPAGRAYKFLLLNGITDIEETGSKTNPAALFSFGPGINRPFSRGERPNLVRSRPRGCGRGKKSSLVFPNTKKEMTDQRERGIERRRIIGEKRESSLAYFRPTANKGSLLRPLSQAYNLKRPVKSSIHIVIYIYIYIYIYVHFAHTCMVCVPKEDEYRSGKAWHAGASTCFVWLCTVSRATRRR